MLNTSFHLLALPTGIACWSSHSSGMMLSSDNGAFLESWREKNQNLLLPIYSTKARLTWIPAEFHFWSLACEVLEDGDGASLLVGQTKLILSLVCEVDPLCGGLIPDFNIVQYENRSILNWIYCRPRNPQASLKNWFKGAASDNIYCFILFRAVFCNGWLLDGLPWEIAVGVQRLLMRRDTVSSLPTRWPVSSVREKGTWSG